MIKIKHRLQRLPEREGLNFNEKQWVCRTRLQFNDFLFAVHATAGWSLFALLVAAIVFFISQCAKSGVDACQMQPDEIRSGFCWTGLVCTALFGIQIVGLIGFGLSKILPPATHWFLRQFHFSNDLEVTEINLLETGRRLVSDIQSPGYWTVMGRRIERTIIHEESESIDAFLSVPSKFRSNLALTTRGGHNLHVFPDVGSLNPSC